MTNDIAQKIAAPESSRFACLMIFASAFDTSLTDSAEWVDSEAPEQGPQYFLIEETLQEHLRAREKALRMLRHGQDRGFAKVHALCQAYSGRRSPLSMKKANALSDELFAVVPPDELLAYAKRWEDMVYDQFGFPADSIPIGDLWADNKQGAMSINGCAVNKFHRVMADIKKARYGNTHKIVSKQGLKGRSHPELLSCPFCGAHPDTDVFEDEEDHFHIVQCTNHHCPVEPIATGATAADAASKWNTRNGGAA